MDNQNVITLKQAASLYKQIVGRKKSKKVLAEEVHIRPHLGYWEISKRDGPRQLMGVRRDRFTYFVKTRLALCGRRQLFHQIEDGANVAGNS